jgi:hypothetical protein
MLYVPSRPEDIAAQTKEVVRLQAEIARLRAEVATWKAEATRLRGGIEAFLAGDYPNPRQHRPSNCEHGRPYYEECGACDAEHFARLIR